MQLKYEITGLEDKLHSHGDKKKKNGAQQKLRGKALNTVLDTGEKAELYRQYFEMNTEVNIYTKRYENLQELNSKTLQSYKDMTEKLKEFEKEYEKIKDKEGIADVLLDKSIIKEKLSKVQKVEHAANWNYNSNIRTLTMKVKKLEEALLKTKQDEEELSSQIEKKSEEYKSQQLALNDLQIRASSNQHKKLFSNGSYSDDLMFITER